MNKTVEEFFADLATTNTIFSVTTTRKNDKKVDGVVVEPAGSEYTSTYRFNVPATVKEAETRLAPGTRRAADVANNIVTAYDMNKKDKDGNKGAFRRINLEGVTEVKARGHVYTVDFDGDDWVVVAS